MCAWLPGDSWVGPAFSGSPALSTQPKEGFKHIGQLVGMLGMLCKDPDKATQCASLEGVGHLYQLLMRQKGEPTRATLAHLTPPQPWAQMDSHQHPELNASLNLPPNPTLISAITVEWPYPNFQAQATGLTPFTNNDPILTPALPHPVLPLASRRNFSGGISDLQGVLPAQC